MKKVLLTITSWNSSSKSYLDRIIDAYRTYQDYEFYIYAAINYPYEKAGVTIVPTTFKGIVHAWACREILAEKYQDYDLIINSDDDVLLTEANLAYYVANQTMSLDYIPGFLVYEREGDRMDIVSMRIGEGVPVEEVLEIDGQKWVVPFKKHSACFVSDPERYGRFLATGHGIKPETHPTLNMQALARTGIYLWGPAKKIVSVSGVLDLSAMVQHLPTKYIDQSKLRPVYQYLSLEKFRKTFAS